MRMSGFSGVTRVSRVCAVAAAASAAVLLAGCSVQLTGIPVGGTAPGAGGAPSAGVDIRPNTPAAAGDCVGIDAKAQDGPEVWVTDCANDNAVARVTRTTPPGHSDTCTVDDYIGFDYSGSWKPSLCLMVYGNPDDCYAGFQKKITLSPRVPCTDQRATVRLAAVVGGRGPCPSTPGDPNAGSLFYGAVPGAGDRTYCISSPRAH